VHPPTRPRTSDLPQTTLRPCGVSTSFLQATPPFLSFATASSDSILAHAINILTRRPTRIFAILTRVRAIVSSRIVTTDCASATRDNSWATRVCTSIYLPPTRAIAATRNSSIGSRAWNKIAPLGRSIALIGSVDFSGCDRILGTNTHDQASSGLAFSPPWYAALWKMKRTVRYGIR
jgi:hypothetical protein